MPHPTYHNGYALLIGIGYENSLNGRLTATKYDIENLYNHFIDSTKAAYPKENVISLYEANATTQGILNALDQLAEMVADNADASVVIYYSGHGGTTGEECFLIPYDFDMDQWSITGGQAINHDYAILSDEFADKIAAIRAKKCLVILDCCHAQGMTNRKGYNRPFLNKFIQPLEEGNSDKTDISVKGLDTDKLSMGGGRVILTSCKEDETSLAYKKESLFTKVLLECLEGTGNLKEDGWVRDIDLRDYVQKQVRDRALKIDSPSTGQGHHQNPIFKTDDMAPDDFIICAYDIGKVKGVKEEEELNIKKDKIMDVEDIVKLIQLGEYVDAFQILDERLGKYDGMYNELKKRYFDRTNNHQDSTYRSQLIVFVRMKLAK